MLRPLTMAQFCFHLENRLNDHNFAYDYKKRKDWYLFSHKSDLWLIAVSMHTQRVLMSAWITCDMVTPCWDCQNFFFHLVNTLNNYTFACHYMKRKDWYLSLHKTNCSCLLITVSMRNKPFRWGRHKNETVGVARDAVLRLSEHK